LFRCRSKSPAIKTATTNATASAGATARDFVSSAICGILRRRKGRAHSKGILKGARETRRLGSGVYFRRRPWEAFAFDLFRVFNAVDAVDVLDAFDFFDGFDFLDAFNAIDLFDVVDLLRPLNPFDPFGLAPFSDRGSDAYPCVASLCPDIS
jgi:hypothetical protein